MKAKKSCVEKYVLIAAARYEAAPIGVIKNMRKITIKLFAMLLVLGMLFSFAGAQRWYWRHHNWYQRHNGAYVIVHRSGHWGWRHHRHIWIVP
jgi:hypothetical protein